MNKKKMTPKKETHKVQATVLQEYRERQGYTKKLLAEKLKVSPQFYGLIEKGTVSLPQDKFYLAARLLKIPHDEFRRALIADFDTKLMLLFKR